MKPLLRQVYTAVQWLTQHPFMLFLGWAIAISFFYFGLGTSSYIRIHDNADSTLSARMLLAQRINEGSLGWWNPALASGDDILASGHLQWSVLLFMLFPDWLAYGLLMLLQRLVAGYFMFRLMRDSTELDLAPAIFAGLAFSSATGPVSLVTTGFTTYDELGLPGFPLVLWMIWYSDQCNGRRGYLIALGTGLLWAFLSVYVFTMFFLPFIVLFFLLIVPRYRLGFWVKVTTFVLGWAILVMPQFLIALTFSDLSHRADFESSALLSSTHTLQILYLLCINTISYSKPYLLPLGIGLLGLIIARGRTLRLIFALGIALLIMLFSSWHPIFYPTLLQHFNMLARAAIHSRIWHIIPLWAALVGGLGLQAISPNLTIWVSETKQSSEQLFHLSFRDIVVWVAMFIFFNKAVP